MRSRTILILAALLAAATGIVVSTSQPHNITTSDVSQVNSAAASTMDARPSGPPPLPASFYGTVAVDGADVPAGTPVSARINGVKYAQTPALIYQGRSTYALDVPADDPATPEVEGGRPGDTVAFYVGGLKADQTAVWHGGTNTELDLTAAGEPGCVVFLPLVRIGGN